MMLKMHLVSGLKYPMQKSWFKSFSTSNAFSFHIQYASKVLLKPLLYSKFVLLTLNSLSSSDKFFETEH